MVFGDSDPSIFTDDRTAGIMLVVFLTGKTLPVVVCTYEALISLSIIYKCGT
jgi:hypothetical protein